MKIEIGTQQPPNIQIKTKEQSINLYAQSGEETIVFVNYTDRLGEVSVEIGKCEFVDGNWENSFSEYTFTEILALMNLLCVVSTYTPKSEKLPLIK